MDSNRDEAGRPGTRRKVGFWIEEFAGGWFGVAYEGERYVATAVSASRQQASVALLRHLPRGVPHDPAAVPTPFARDAVRMLAAIEAGDEEHKRFELSEEYLPPYLRATLTVAAAIPIGCVTTYGDVGSVSGVIARTVGRIMAVNPLYPIVPCHRVVGSDMTLVGYGGKQDPQALRSKLARLRAEARGVVMSEVKVSGGTLRLYPAERVIDRAAGTVADTIRQLSLFG